MQPQYRDASINLSRDVTVPAWISPPFHLAFPTPLDPYFENWSSPSIQDLSSVQGTPSKAPDSLFDFFDLDSPFPLSEISDISSLSSPSFNSSPSAVSDYRSLVPE